MDQLLVTVLKAVMAQQAMQATRRTARGGLIAAAMLPVGIGVVLIALTFLGLAAYNALTPDLSDASAAVVVAGLFVLLLLVMALIVWLLVDGGPKKAPDLIPDPIEDVIAKVTGEVRKKPGSMVLLAGLAGAFAYVMFNDKK